jgi:hypothetical protein
MKKITALSKFAIKLGKLYSYITSANLDFMKITENFKEQSHLIVLELSNLLEILTPSMFKEILNNISNEDMDLNISIKPTHSEILEKINLKEEDEKEQIRIDFEREKQKNEEVKRDIIFESLEEKEEFDFELFENNVVDTVKKLENFLQRVIHGEYEDLEIERFIEQLSVNRSLAVNSGFSIIADLHYTVEKALEKIIYHQLEANQETIEGIRSCLIVIVAVVREKDVDISNYLKKAKRFGKLINSIK